MTVVWFTYAWHTCKEKKRKEIVSDYCFECFMSVCCAQIHIIRTTELGLFSNFKGYTIFFVENKTCSETRTSLILKETRQLWDEFINWYLLRVMLFILTKTCRKNLSLSGLSFRGCVCPPTVFTMVLGISLSFVLFTCGCRSGNACHISFS